MHLCFPWACFPASYEQDASTGLLTVHFRGGQQPPVQAGLLVAADGYFSRVRRQAVGDGPPSYGKTVVWRARLPAASAVAAGLDLGGSSSAFVQDLGRFFFAYPISSGDYVWTVGVSGETARVGASDGVSLLTRCFIDAAANVSNTEVVLRQGRVPSSACCRLYAVGCSPCL
jgi:2-polyprenyl-6-methoxyphenol hydroxylase-like FAD-dependent oxidoreductase